MAISRIARFFSVVLPLLAVASPALAADDDPLAFWKRAKSQAENDLKGLHAIGTLHFQDLFQLRRNGGSIELVSHAPATTGSASMTATFDDIAGAAEVHLHRQPNTLVLDRFKLNLRDFPTERRTVEIRVELDRDKAELTLARSIQNDGVFEQVMLVQSHPAVAGPSNFIQLHYSRSAMNNAQSEQITFSSPDFASFLQNRPDETSKYLRPLLRELEQETLFAPDQRIAEQVFGGLRRVDPAIQKQVVDLLPAFNASGFQTRNAASAKLKALGRAAADVLDRMDRMAFSPEQNLRIDLFLTHYDPLSPKELSRLRQDSTFLLDCLYSENVDVRWAALEQLRNVFNPVLQFDPEAPDEARSVAIAALRRRLVPGS